MMSNKVLVTGCAGFIGAALVKELLLRGKMLLVWIILMITMM